jgi:adenosylhomocysteine nucleosidase
MQTELEPLVRQLSLVGEGDSFVGRLGDVEIVAMLTNIGMSAAAVATRRMIERGVDWVMVVGIAGGIDRGVPIGDVIVPEIVLDRASGERFEPHRLDDSTPRGTLSCGDDLILDPEHLEALAAEGVVAVDMETAAVAAVCEQHECRWSVFRAISDHPAEGLIDDGLFALTGPDGTADRDALARYLEEKPGRIDALTRLAHDTARATEAAATAAVRACARL